MLRTEVRYNGCKSFLWGRGFGVAIFRYPAPVIYDRLLKKLVVKAGNLIMETKKNPIRDLEEKVFNLNWRPVVLTISLWCITQCSRASK